MSKKLIGSVTLWTFAFLVVPRMTWAQYQIPTTGRVPTGVDLNNIERQTWHVFGKVTDLSGQPVRDANVRVDIGNGVKFVKELKTDVQGEFRTEYNLDAVTNTGLAVKLLVTREGFYAAHEFVDFGKGNKTWEIDVKMRAETEDMDDLSTDSLIQLFGPQLRTSLQNDASLAPARKDVNQGVEYFLEKHDSVKAIESLDKVAKRFPSCANCLTMLGLAKLDAGSWNGATNDLASAAQMASSEGSKTDQVNSLVIIAELENWKGEYAKAAGFLMQAKDLEPKNPFVLQELGRTLIFQKNWEAADDYLGQAVSAGAPKGANLLRARACLEEGDAEAANGAMKEYLGSNDIKAEPVPVRRLYSEIDSRMKLRTYAKVKSVVDEPLPVLTKSIPELDGLRPTANQNDLKEILQKTGESVQTFFQNFQNTISTENVREERLNKDGKLKEALDQKFQYLLVTKPEKWGLGLEEFRTNSSGDRAAPVGLDAGLMLTSGFASASLLFHPAYQSGSSFRNLGKQSRKGQECYVVAFAQLPAKAQTVERFATSKDSVLVLFQGLAWVDAQTYHIVKLRTDLLKPQTSIRLQRQTTEITYDPVRFKQIAAALWLPSEVAVTVEWQGKTFHNQHKYSDFKLFNTDTKEKVHKPAAPTE